MVIEGASLGTPRFAVIPGAALAMYYVLNVFLFLILAQFFIAILGARRRAGSRDAGASPPAAAVPSACAPDRAARPRALQ